MEDSTGEPYPGHFEKCRCYDSGAGTCHHVEFNTLTARAEAREKALADRIEVLETECRESLTERDAARTEALTCLEARRKALVRSEEVIMGLQAERDALAATVKELLGCLASADWDSHEMDDARRLLESWKSDEAEFLRHKPDFHLYA